MPKKKYFAQLYVEYELNEEVPWAEAHDFARFMARDISNQLGVTDAFLNDWGEDDKECPVCDHYK